MLILSEKDKWNIAHMRKEDTKYLVYPNLMTMEEAKKFMKT
jgi:hypothetical protein